MTTNEFLNEFNIGWNNIMSNQAPGLTPYEIAVFLTQAQESVVKGIYNGTLTNSFESTEEARSYLTPLVVNGYPVKLVNQDKYPHITKGTLLYSLSDIEDINKKPLKEPWFITYEGVIFKQSNRCNEGDEGIVKPVTQDTFWEIRRNPFKRDNERRVLRLTYNQDNKNIAELVTDYQIDKYFIRYIRKPNPIVLADAEIEDDKPIWTIDSISTVTECELNENLHRVILDMAIRLAKQAWVNLKTKEE